MAVNIIRAVIRVTPTVRSLRTLPGPTVRRAPPCPAQSHSAFHPYLKHFDRYISPFGDLSIGVLTHTGVHYTRTVSLHLRTLYKHTPGYTIQIQSSLHLRPTEDANALHRHHQDDEVDEYQTRRHIWIGRTDGWTRHARLRPMEEGRDARARLSRARSE